MKYLKTYESVSNKIILTSSDNTETDNIFKEDNIYFKNKKIGYISYSYKDGVLEIHSIYVKDKNKGVGTEALKLLAKKIKPKEIIGSALSKQSLKSLIKAFGAPYNMSSVFKVYDTVEDALEFLPNYANVVDGEVVGGESDGIFFKIRTDKKIKEDMKYLKTYESFSSDILYHGSTDKDLAGTNGIHIGTKLAATQALEARIGVPVVGEWDGTREYGKTLLAGKETLAKPENKWKSTGFNCCSVPEKDYYPTERKERAAYSDGTPISFDCKPIVFPVRIIGKMSNSTYNSHKDSVANGLMRRNLKMGNAKSGYYYINDGEDVGSISAVVPNKNFLQII